MRATRGSREGIVCMAPPKTTDSVPSALDYTVADEGSRQWALARTLPPPAVCDMPSGCSLFMGPLDSPTFVPSCAAPGRCVRTAAAACVPCGVLSVLAASPPSSGRTGGCAGCCGGRFTVFAAQSPPHVVHHMRRHVSVRVRPICSARLKQKFVYLKSASNFPPL